MAKVANVLRKPFAAIVLSVFLGFVVGAVVLLAAGFNPIEAYASLFAGIFSKPKYIALTIIKSTPIIITGVSVASAFRAGLFNIGTEGQFIAGCIAAAFVGTNLQLPPVIHPIVVMIASMAAGAIWGGLVGILKAKFGIHEVISSIMLNWIAFYMNNLYITLPGMKQSGTESSYKLSESAYITVLQQYKTSKEGIEALRADEFLSEVLLKTDLNYGILFAIIIAVVVWFVLKKTTLGYSVRSVGFNPLASEMAGISVKKNILYAMLIAGAVSGLAGAVYMTGMNPHRISSLAVMEGWGLSGISVALIANLHPIGCIFAGLLFGGLKYASSSIQAEMGAPSEIINIMIGAIVFFIAMSNIFVMLSDYILKRRAHKNE